MPLKLSVHYHASCVLNLFYGGLLPGKRDKKKKKARKLKRERDHYSYGQNDTSRDMMPCTLNDILRNPSPPKKKKIKRKTFFFLIQIL